MAQKKKLQRHELPVRRTKAQLHAAVQKAVAWLRVPANRKAFQNDFQKAVEHTTQRRNSTRVDPAAMNKPMTI